MVLGGWAFDRGAISINNPYEIIVSDAVKENLEPV
jgi:predicted restriction endonuclease